MGIHAFALPDPGEGLTQAVIATWRVAPGDDVVVNQVLVEVETAKSLVELPSPWTGRVVGLAAQEGDTVRVGAALIHIETPDDAAPPTPEPPAPRVLVGYGPTAPPAGAREMAGEGEGPPSSAVPGPDPDEVRPVLAKPPVRALAKHLGIDVATVRASGPGGIVTREDVLAASEEQSPGRLAGYPGDETPWLTGGTVARDGRSTRVPVRSVRKRTAEAMVTSAFTAPHVTVFRTVDVTSTMRLVTRLREGREFADVRVTPLLIVAKALLLAVHRHPEINAAWDSEAQEIVYKHYVNLGIAAQTERGLLVPNIKDAHRLPLRALAVALGELTAAARAGTTTPRAMADGTITITNVGVFGIDAGTPILSPGEAAILAFGAVERRPWVHAGKIKARHVTELALSFDHRLVDGALGSVVLSDVARILTDPAQALVWS
ncbi:MAG: 2-oxo acid dehydrogenase subunit E2 [Bifidobacteriaceae bacterium]|jgi:pyruvate dehydrogenase E2 component (dihydrolipoamide acetyltransferase)|nr:2-oxo acid dehydrogenase subunit E2 [Bifidobacteriaceae bacterium]